MKRKEFTINVVPFIDVMLVLLVIVLTTASFIQTGVIKVDLPASSSEAMDKPKKELRLAINIEGKIFLDKQELQRSQVEATILQQPKDTPINVHCDKGARFDNFVFIMDILKKNGYENLGIVTENE